MKFTKPTIIAGAIVTLVAGTGVAFAATDTFITKAPANDKPTRVYTQPAETPAPTNDVSSPASAENDTTTETNTAPPLATTPEINTTEAPTNEAPTQNPTTPTVEAPSPVENVTNVSNDNNSSSVSNNGGEGVGVTYN